MRQWFLWMQIRGGRLGDRRGGRGGGGSQPEDKKKSQGWLKCLFDGGSKEDRDGRAEKKATALERNSYSGGTIEFNYFIILFMIQFNMNSVYRRAELIQFILFSPSSIFIIIETFFNLIYCQQSCRLLLQTIMYTDTALMDRLI
jgi:hypothetical protein